MTDALDRNDVFFASRSARIRAARPAPNGKPHVTRLYHHDGQVSDVFHVKPVYYQTKDGFWRPLSEIAAHHGNKRIVLKPNAMDKASTRYLLWLMNRQSILRGTLEFGYPNTFYWGVQPNDLYTALSLEAYPDANPETTTVDGYIYINGSSWAQCRNASEGDAADSSSTTAVIGVRPTLIQRGFFLFDTSSLGDPDTVTATTLALYVTAVVNNDNDGNDFLTPVSASPASNTDLLVADYNDVGSTAYVATGTDIGSLTTSAYNTFTFNATGRDAVSKTGVSKFAMREGHDYANDPAAGTNTVTVSTADHTGTSQDPKLTVTYTPGTPGDGLGVSFF